MLQNSSKRRAKLAAARVLRLVHDPVTQRVRQSTALTRLLFGVKPFPRQDEDLWDYTTLVLYKAGRRYLRAHTDVWDLGCGSNAIVGLSLARLADIRVVASDRDPFCVMGSARAVARSKTPDRVRVLASDLDSNVHQQFDLVLFNAPYLPARNMTWWPSTPLDAAERERFMLRFAGGDDGLDTVRRLLRCVPSKLRPEGRLLLGFNRVYVSPARLNQLVSESGLVCRDTVTSPTNPACVLVLEVRP